jgi:Ca2+-binding EF-hand superfamily protein
MMLIKNLRSGAIKAAAIASMAAFSMTLSTAAHALTQEQQAQAFLSSDANGDRNLNRTEFRVFINTLAEAGLPVAKRVRRWGVYGIAFSRSDADKSGLLSTSELLKANTKFKNAGPGS